MIIGHEAYYRSRGNAVQAVLGRGAFQRRRRHPETGVGFVGKENVGISNDKAGEKPAHR